MKKKIFGVLLVFALAVLLGNGQSADAATSDYEMVPTATDGKTTLLNENGKQCVNPISGYNTLYKGQKTNSICCNRCGGWIYTCFYHKLELSIEDYDKYTESQATTAHASYYFTDCAGWNSRNGAGTNHSTRIYYKTEVYKVTNSERVTLSD